jgi:hypothetical protein
VRTCAGLTSPVPSPPPQPLRQQLEILPLTAGETHCSIASSCDRIGDSLIVTKTGFEYLTGYQRKLLMV